VDRREGENPGRLKCLVAAFGDPGHVFPAISLSKALAGRGHEVVLETWPQWEDLVKGEGLGFASADQYQVFPPPSSGIAGGGEAAVALMPLLEEFQPDVVVNDILTVAPSLAAEKFGCRRVTLVPHLWPEGRRDYPFFSIGALPPRTPVGRAFWRSTSKILDRGLIRGRDDLNAQRRVIGLPPTDRFHGATSPDLDLIATFPQLEYESGLPERAVITGPMPWEAPHPDVDLPDGDDPLILVAPSTSQDPDNRLVRAALDGLAGLPVRVVATTNRVVPSRPIEVPANAVLVDWLRYSQVIPLASVVICHGGHGTVARSLAEGVPLLVCPIAGDMNENAIRVTWSGTGLSIRWSLVGPGSVRWAVAELLGDESFAGRAREISRWSEDHDGPTAGARLIEALAG
jgi:UDP:flavonoid glycosyltransferase YjiC (YdhE family)